MRKAVQPVHFGMELGMKKRRTAELIPSVARRTSAVMDEPSVNEKFISSDLGELDIEEKLLPRWRRPGST